MKLFAQGGVAAVFCFLLQMEGSKVNCAIPGQYVCIWAASFSAEMSSEQINFRRSAKLPQQMTFHIFFAEPV